MLISIALHILVIAVLVLLAPATVSVIAPTVDERPRTRRPIFLHVTPNGEGGGGQRNLLPPSRGRLPRFALRQFAPPMVEVVHPNPRLAVEPTLLVRTSTELQPITGPIGLPDGMPGPPSGGSGGPAGIGAGGRSGVGDRDGSGVEGLQPVPLRGDMKAPVVIFKLEPEYSEQARKARIQGTVVLEGVIDTKGLTHAVKVRDGLGFGLDEQAIEAVKQWRFRPATKDGKPLAIVGTFYLTFRLL